MTTPTFLAMVMAILALGACSKPAATSGPLAAAATPAAPQRILSLEGYGPVRFGTRLSDVEQQLGSRAEPPGATDPACSVVRFSAVPGASFMVENGVITRADADAGTGNSLGVTVGDSLAQVTAKHPHAVVSAHKYDPSGHYLTVSGADSRAAIVLELDGTGVTKIRAGLQPAVAYVESCL